MVAFCVLVLSLPARAAGTPNLLLITVDDMSADSVGVFGARTPGTTPNIDRLARQGLRFDLAHVQVANCNPSRNVMWSGRYPHSNRVEGFDSVRNPGYDTLPDLLRSAGYFTAIRHKVNDSSPYHPYPWDLVLDSAGVPPHPRNPGGYGVSTALGIAAAADADKPFALLINIGDPHVPFFGRNKAGQAVADPHPPTRVFRADEVSVPGFLVDDPVVRAELAAYYSSVRRADDAVGSVLAALDKSGQARHTLVMFLSDHGMPFPFAKTQLYHHSTRTPLLFRWPGEVAAGTVDEQHMVSAVDLLPTLLDVAGVTHPSGLQGQSLLPLLRGEPQAGRDFVFKEYNESASRQRAPMRAVQDRRYLYIFNAWSNGKRQMGSATLKTDTFGRMLALAADDDAIAARNDLLIYRVPEELYDVTTDPDCLVNLVDEPGYQLVAARLRDALAQHMRRTGDHALAPFEGRAEPGVVEAYMVAQEQAAQERRAFIRAIQKEMAKEKQGTAPAP